MTTAAGGAPATGRVAVVTGAGSGIGRAIALALVREGYQVVLAGRNAGTLAATQQAATYPGSAIAVVTDVREAASVDALFAAVRDRFGRLDLLVNNAGVFGPRVPLEEVSEPDWQAVVETNLSGAFRCAQAAFRLMKEQSPGGGRIINNGSLSAYAPRPNSVAYVATKHAITGLTKALSLEGRKYNVACGQIDIGNAATEMTARMSDGVLQANGSVEVEPVFDVEHVASTVVHMAGLPLRANVQFVTVMASAMPYIGRG
jgi:NAD(P)-dependent dehydrogenase (short-subunit alcohol dehydrogenase family)